ncbi:MAG: hypothetical protein RJA99_3231 [Pseudomonadota bacterium]|jgi:hypothetical protein
MISYDLMRARMAVQFLVDSSYFHQHVRKLRTAVVRPRAMPFKADAEPLNELLVIGRQNVQAMENLIEVAQIKRDGRNDYQRQYMAAKRQRDRKVVEFEERVLGKKLAPEAKVQVLHRQYATWNRERDAYIKSMGEVTWTERNDRLREFWARKEREIDALIEEAKVNGPVKRKRIVKVAPKPSTAFGEKLTKAIQYPPSKR